MRGGEDVKVTLFDISPKFTLFWVILGQNRGSKRVKTCPSPNKTQYRCYFKGLGHVRGGEDVKMTLFDISPKFTLFWIILGQNWGSKRVKAFPYTNKTRYKCCF